MAAIFGLKLKTQIGYYKLPLSELLVLKYFFSYIQVHLFFHINTLFSKLMTSFVFAEAATGGFL